MYAIRSYYDGGLNYGYTWVQQEAQNVNKNTRAVNTSISSNMPLFAGVITSYSIHYTKLYDQL